MSETNTVSPLRQRMIEDMAARKLNPHTQRSHISVEICGLANGRGVRSVSDARRRPGGSLVERVVGSAKV